MADKVKVISACASACSTVGEAVIANGATAGITAIVEEGFEIISGVDPTIMAALYATDLTIDVIYNIWSWYNGTITGKRCSANISAATFRAGGGLLGGMAGIAAFGMILGPSTPVIIAGAITGMVVGGYNGLRFADLLNRMIFGLPTSVVLEQAYESFGVSCNATPKEVNTAYRKFCLRHHPDKQTGDKDMFLKGQFYMEVIRADRMQQK